MAAMISPSGTEVQVPNGLEETLERFGYRLVSENESEKREPEKPVKSRAAKK